MIYLAIEKETGKARTESDNELLREEALKVHQLSIEGIIREIYFNDDHCAVLILECKSKEEAEIALFIPATGTKWSYQVYSHSVKTLYRIRKTVQ